MATRSSWAAQGHDPRLAGALSETPAGSSDRAAFDRAGITAAAHAIRETAHVVRGPDGRIGVCLRETSLPRLGTLPPLYPEWLGDRAFQEAHGVRFPYVAGAMANGIASADLVIAMARAQMLAFFGAAGLSLERVARGLDEIEANVPSGATWGANLIHSPNEPALEADVAELFLKRGVTRVSASAYMSLTAPLVRYAFTGVRRVGDRVERGNHVFAKISRPETARHFMSPPPKALLDRLVQQGQLTADEAGLAATLPVAEDVTVEADSGGHTDNQTLTAVFPVIAQLRDALTEEHRYARPIRVGAAGGIGTPRAVAGAFSLGAAYVLTGSVNQGSVEAGLSDAGKKLLATASMADVMMAPAADMFEMGVEVQVLRRGTMFGPRARRLYEAYKQNASLEAMPAAVREKLEREVLGRPAEDIWSECEAFFTKRDPHELEKAAKDPKHRMALVFRWYLGLSSKWAIAGDEPRRLDYQIWCGPAMGAFNDWVRGSFLESPEARGVVQIALNLLEGAACVTRAHQLRTYGAPVPPSAYRFVPRPLS